MKFKGLENKLIYRLKFKNTIEKFETRRKN